jgi:pimeloyl-ACP methyl ester carboxylesterase
MHLAASTGADVAGVVVRSGYLSALAVAMGRAGAALPGSPFDVAAHARRVKAPVLIIHGDLDELIGMWQAEELVRLCGGAVEPMLVEGHGHFDVEWSPLFLPRLTRFLMQETRR